MSNVLCSKWSVLMENRKGGNRSKEPLVRNQNQNEFHVSATKSYKRSIDSTRCGQLLIITFKDANSNDVSCVLKAKLLFFFGQSD